MTILYHTKREPFDNLTGYFDVPPRKAIGYCLTTLTPLPPSLAQKLTHNLLSAPSAAHSLDEHLEAARKAGSRWVDHDGQWWMYRGSYNGRASWLPVSEHEECKDRDYLEEDE